MNPDKIISAVADLINGDINHAQAVSVVDQELADSVDLEETDKGAIRALIQTYSGSGEMVDFISRVSEILRNSSAVLRYADEDGE